NECGVKVWKDALPVARARRYEDAQAGVFVRFELFVEALRRTVLPRHGNHILGQDLEQLGVVHGDVAPEHKPLVLGPHDLTDALEVFKINSTQPDFFHTIPGLALTELKRLVRAYVKQWTGKQRHQLGIQVLY